MGGGGDKKGGGGSSAASDAQVQMAQKLFQQTDPIRTKLFGRANDFLAGGADVTNTPAYAAMKTSTDANFNRAKDNLIAATPTGGALTSALTNLEGNRAATLTGGAGQLYGDELSRAIALGTGVTGQSLASMGQAGAVQAQIAQARAEQSAGKSQGLGQGVGAVLGAK